MECFDRVQVSPRVDFSFNPLAETAFRWQDARLLTLVEQGDEHVCLFFRVLALCHTVMVENKDGCLKYQAQSPDENALVSAARNFGFVFTVSHLLGEDAKATLVNLYLGVTRLLRTSFLSWYFRRKIVGDLIQALGTLCVGAKPELDHD